MVKSVFVPKETAEGETRVAAVPSSVKKLCSLGLKVLVEAGAGSRCCIEDSKYAEAGAEVVSADVGYSSADLIASVNPPALENLSSVKEECSLLSFLSPEQEEILEGAIYSKKLSVFSFNAIPRISRAQSVDALSSQTNLAGYKAVLLAATASPKIFPMMMTAAGTLRPARVLVMGAGVAGLQAVATAKRLGAVVEVSDIRPAVKEQVESLGATYLDVPSDESMETDGGYAVEASAEFLKKQAEITLTHILSADVVITTALVPGKKAPRLIDAETVAQMKPGSVIVDLAASQGGNCELTRPNEVYKEGDVVIMGTLNLPATLPVHASDLYARNVLNVIASQVGDEGFAWDLEDEIVQGALKFYCGTPPSEIPKKKLAIDSAAVMDSASAATAKIVG